MKKGKKHRSQRGVDVETLFGIIKKNKGFKRFMLRGREKVKVEMGLLAMAHNIKKARDITCLLGKNPFKEGLYAFSLS